MYDASLADNVTMQVCESELGPTGVYGATNDNAVLDYEEVDDASLVRPGRISLIDDLTNSFNDYSQTPSHSDLMIPLQNLQTVGKSKLSVLADIPSKTSEKLLILCRILNRHQLLQ